MFTRGIIPLTRVDYIQSNAIYADGFLLLVRGGQLMSQPFDAAKGTLSGEIQNLASGVLEDASTSVRGDLPRRAGQAAGFH